MKSRSYRDWAQIAVILACITLVTGFPQLLYPLWFDQGAFATCADVLLRGGTMWRDCWEVRGPLTPLLYALPALIDRSALALHAFDLLWQWLTACALATVAWRLFASRMAALLGGVLYVLMYASLNFWATAQAEGFANLFICLALLCALQPRATRLSAFVAGLCMAALFWLKYPLAAMGVIPLVVLWVRRGAPWHIATAGAVAGIVTGLALIALTGAWPDFLLHLSYDTSTFLLKPLDERWRWFTGLFWIEISTFAAQGNTPTAFWKDTVQQVELLGRGYPWLMLLLALALGQTLAWRQLRSARLLGWGWLALGIGLNILQGHSYRYHFVIWLPAMALLAGGTVAGFARWGWSELAGVQRLAALGCSALAIAGMLLTLWPWLRDAAQNLLIERKPLQAIHAEALTNDYTVMARWLHDNTTPNDHIVIFSDVPAIYRLADRAPGTRFPYFRWAVNGKGAQAEYEAQTLADLERNQPKYFVLSKDGFPWADARFIDTWKRLKSVNTHVEANYAYVTDIGPFVVFAKR